MRVEIDVNELKEELSGYLRYVKVSISVEPNIWQGRNDYWIEVTAKPISPLDIILGSLYWRIEAKKYNDTNKYVVHLGDLADLLERRKDIERLEDQCRLAIEKLRKLVEEKEVVE